MSSDAAVIATGCGVVLAWVAFWVAVLCGVVYLVTNIIVGAF